MSYVTKVEIVQNDFAYPLEFKMQDSSGSAVNLSTAGSVVFYAWTPKNTISKVVGTCIINDAANGGFYYTVGSLDFVTGDTNYFVQTKAFWAGTKVLTGRGVTIFVEKEAPRGTV